MRTSTFVFGIAAAYLVTALAAIRAAGDELRFVARQQQDPNSPLFLDEPACDSYQCNVTYHPGDTATAHWLNAPDGNVELDLMTNASSVVFTKIAIVPGVSKDCKAEKGKTCGQFRWIVPSAWVDGNYTLRALSVNNPNIESYTDVILVTNKPGESAAKGTPVYFKALDPVATDFKQPTVVGAEPGVMAGDGASNGTTDSKAPAATFTGASGSAPTPTSNGTSPHGSTSKNGALASAEASLLSLVLPLVAAALMGGVATVHL